MLHEDTSFWGLFFKMQLHRKKIGILNCRIQHFITYVGACVVESFVLFITGWRYKICWGVKIWWKDRYGECNQRIYRLLVSEYISCSDWNGFLKAVMNIPFIHKLSFGEVCRSCVIIGEEPVAFSEGVSWPDSDLWLTAGDNKGRRKVFAIF